MADSTARVSHVIDQNGDAIPDVADQNHSSNLVGLLALLVNQGKVHVQPVSNRSNTARTRTTDYFLLLSKQNMFWAIRHSQTNQTALPLGSASIGRHDDAIPPVGNVLFDPLKNGRLGVQIVDGDIKESLNLRGM